MSESTDLGRHWSRKTWFGLTAAMVVLVPVAAFGVWKWMVNDSADAIPTDEIVAQYRAATTVATVPASATTAPAAGATAPTTAPTTASAGTPVAGTSAPTTAVPTVATVSTTVAGAEDSPTFELPEPGVYRYATSGFEQIDVLGGARHDYPAETTITVTRDGCGVRLRWDALRQRREEWRLCITADGIELEPDSVQYHEFFDRGEEEPVDCDTGVVVIASDPGARSRVDQSCFRVDEAWLPIWEVVGMSTITVEGADVEAVHVREQVVDDDDYWEHTTIDWYLAPNGLPVRVHNVKSSKSPSFVGDVVYDEEYELTLDSLTPIT